MELPTANLTDKKKVTVSIDEAHALHEEAQAFEMNFQKEKMQFAHSDDSIYYIVSSQFLTEWRDYATAHTLERYLPSIMNFDLIQNNALKPDLKEGEDFQFLSENLYRQFHPYKRINFKRKAVMVGNQKRIPLYLDQFRYLPISHDTLRIIDINGGQLSVKSIEASRQNTVQDLLEFIRTQERYSIAKQLRLWRIGQKSIKQVYKYIKKQTAQINSRDLKIKFFGKKITGLKVKLGDFQLGDQQFLVVQVKDDMKRWHLYSDTEGKCQGCLQICELKFTCGCKKVAYCTEHCQQRDKVYHSRFCEYPEMEELLKPIEMKLTSSSAKGKVGLSNLGNTCFMNSCLQCLSHTLPLTEYFLAGYFQKQINRQNPLGTKGKLAKTYAKFIKSMWCDSNSTFSPNNIKNAVSSINPIFSGYAQHDSQQFFSFLVDGLHEDLNRIEMKPFVESVDSNRRPDNIVALESWIAHIKRNQSIVVDLMTGQYRSKVTCPDCNKQSITFDPFITVTLPIPQKVINSFQFFLIHANMMKKTQRYYLSYEKIKAEDWIATASKLTGCAVGSFGLYVVSKNQGIFKVGRQSTNQILHKVDSQRGNYMFFVQFSEEDLSLKKPLEIPVQFMKKASYDFDNLWFKYPFFFEKGYIKGINIYVKLLKFLYGQAYKYCQHRQTFIKSFSCKTYEEYEKQMLQYRPFTVFLKYGKKIQRLYHRSEYVFQHEKQIKDQDLISQFIGKLPVGDFQIHARFQRNSLQNFNFQNLTEFDDKMKKPPVRSSDEMTVSIDQCFHYFREVEKLQVGNEWYCPDCHLHKQAIKELNIYKAPKILILHLKRFKQKGILRKEKNESKVEFPMELNMKEHLIDSTPMSTYISEAKKQNVYVEPKVDNLTTSSLKPIYELYAVSNHFGGLGGGHYTAYAKNYEKWYEFNDSSVKSCSESSVCSSGAYILFYKRKDE